MAIGRLNIGLTGVQPGGLAKIIPTSVAVGSGSGSVDSNGKITFSGASSISINGCFTSTYDRYLILLDSTGSNTGDIKYRMRLSGTDNTSTAYHTQYTDMDANSTSSGRNAAATSATIGQTATTKNINEILVYSPATTDYTIFFARSAFYGLIKNLIISSAHEVATAYDGITIFPNTGTFTGKLSIYGYN